ncbi:acetyl-CoA carboxylase biotin carboxyl carrier protein [Nucisporomicrobium flavum]|uniref:acetyl-CoA carboxylase biotin carboxyl carrier protein n=1 Tax=Nucisporomicrobium flavum TaxID=2785915 RepID=UPI003C308089
MSISMDDGVGELDRLMGDSRQDTLPATLEMTRDSVIELLAKISPMPRTLKVSVGPVAIELDWTEGTAGPVRHEAPALPAAPETRPAAVAADDDVDHVHAPIVGVFYVAPEPGARPFVSVGDVVTPGQQIGLVEAMKLMIPVEADRHCRIVEFLQPNGTAVEYGDPLFAVAPVQGG